MNKWWQPILANLSFSNVKSYVLPNHPCFTHALAENAKSNFSTSCAEAQAMSKCFNAENGEFVGGNLLDLIQARKQVQIDAYDKIEMPHKDGFFSIQIRTLRHVDLEEKTVFEKFQIMKDRLGFIKILNSCPYQKQFFALDTLITSWIQCYILCIYLAIKLQSRSSSRVALQRESQIPKMISWECFWLYLVADTS